MRKFNVTIASITTTVNANEYSVFPKTNLFKTAEGQDAASTSGKGKSAVNNHYLYAKHEGVIFYFKSSAEQIAAARASGFSFLPEENVTKAEVKAAEGFGIAPEAPAPEAEAVKQPKRARAKARA